VTVRVAFHRSLAELWNQLVELAERDSVAVQRASLAMLDSNRQLAELVISEQSDIQELGDEVEERAAELLARESPVASDLRLVLTAIPMAASMVRMGGLAAHVARTTRLRTPGSVVADQLRGVFAGMGETALSMVSELTTALRERDVAAAAAVRTTDETMDRLHREMFAVTLAPEWSDGIEAAVDAALLGRYFERFADQAVSNADRLHFIVTGEHVDA
jgi:phosphate transport system protein